MNAMVKDRCGFIIGGLIVVIVIVIILCLRKEELPPIDLNRITVSLDEHNRVLLEDANGKPIEKVELDKDDPLGSAFSKEGLPKELHGTSAMILGFPGSSCNPTIIIGNSCSAPHRSCCY